MEQSKKKQRKFTEEFRQSALKLASDIGSVSRAAKQLGVAEGNLYNWRDKANKQKLINQNNSGLGDFEKGLASDREEIRRLRLENKRLEQVNEILKKAAAIFSRDHL